MVERLEVEPSQFFFLAIVFSLLGCIGFALHFVWLNPEGPLLLIFSSVLYVLGLVFAYITRKMRKTQYSP